LDPWFNALNWLERKGLAEGNCKRMLFLLTYKFRMSSQKIDILNHEMTKDFVKACWPNFLCQLMVKHLSIDAQRVDLLQKRSSHHHTPCIQFGLFIFFLSKN